MIDRIAPDGLAAAIGSLATRVWWFSLDQLGGAFLAPGSTLSLAGLIITLLLAAILAVPRGRPTLPRLRVWRRALLPNRLVTTPSGRADIAWFVFGTLFFGLLFSGCLLSTGVVAKAVTASLRHACGPSPFVAPEPLAGTILTVAGFLAYDLAYWLDHRVSHASPVLWQFHRVHHAAESLSLLTNFRVHPVDTIVFYNIVAVVMGGTTGALQWLLGGSATGWLVGGTNALVLITAISLTHLQHSHLWIEFGPRWNKWLLSPAHHQVHHSVDPADFDRNFGNVLAIWDRLFSTLRVPAARREPLGFGLGTEDAAPHSWRAATIDPFARAARIAIASVLRRSRVRRVRDAAR